MVQKVITFECEKQKDSERFDTVVCKLHGVGGLGFNEDGDELSSAVVVPADGYIPTPHMDKKTEGALVALASCPNGTASFREWWTKSAPQVPERTFHGIRERLQPEYVDRVRKGTYQVTELGRATAENLQRAADSVVPSPAATAPTPEGGAVQEGITEVTH